MNQLGALTLTCSEDGTGDIAPLIFAKQRETIQAQVDDALSKGATCLLLSGEAEAGGIVPAYALKDVNHDMLIMQEETFGPVIPVVTFDDIEQPLHWLTTQSLGYLPQCFPVNGVRLWPWQSDYRSVRSASMMRP